MCSLTFAEERANALDCARIGREILSDPCPAAALRCLVGGLREGLARRGTKDSQRGAEWLAEALLSIARSPQPVARWKALMSMTRAPGGSGS